MLASFNAELMKLRKRPATLVLAVVWLAMQLTFGYLLPYFSADGPGAGPLQDTLPAGLVGNAVGGMALFGGALAMILGVLVAGSEYGWATIKTVLTQRPGRLSVYGGMLATLAIAVLGMAVLTFAVSAGASAIIAVVESTPLDWPGIGDIAQGMAAGWLVLGMWCLFGVLLGTLTRGTTMAIGLGLVWALVVESVIRASAGTIDLLASLQEALPGVNGGSLIAALGARPIGQQDGTPGVAPIVGGTQATVALLLFVLAFAAVAGWLQQRRDVA